MESKISERVFLRAFEYSDLEFVNKLRNSEDLYKHTCGNKYYISSEYDKKWIEDKIFNNTKQIYLVICLIDNNSQIGYLSLNDIDHINKKAQWGGIIIDSKYSNKGYATESANLLLNYAFEELNINRIYGYWLESNVPSLRVGEKLGFTKEGLMRDYVFKQNRFHNAYICSLLRKDYDK